MVTGQHIGSPFIFKVTLELYLVWFNTSCTFYRLDCQVSCICSSDTMAVWTHPYWFANKKNWWHMFSAFIDT